MASFFSRRNKAKEPRTKGVAKVPVVMQLEALECGAASLAMVMAYYGKWVPLEQVREDCGVSRDGSKASNIWDAAEHYGFEVDAYKTTPEHLKESGTFPCIIHWNMEQPVAQRARRKGKLLCAGHLLSRQAVSVVEVDPVMRARRS